MGDFYSAITYGKRFDYAYNYSQSHLLLSETFTYDYLNLPQHKNSFNVIEIPFRFKRVRVQGNIHIRDSGMPSPLQQIAGGGIASSGSNSVDKSTLHSSWIFHKLWYRNDVNDPYNIYCSPTPKLTPTEVYKIYAGKKLHLDNYDGMKIYEIPQWYYLIYPPFSVSFFVFLFVVLFFCFTISSPIRQRIKKHLSETKINH